MSRTDHGRLMAADAGGSLGGEPHTADGVGGAGEDAKGWLRDEPVLRVEDLVTSFKSPAGPITPVAGVSFDLLPRETLGLVGESGCGKTTTGRAIMQLPGPSGGSVHFEGNDLRALSKKQLRDVRRRLQMIFQDPLSSLNPRRRVVDIVAEGLSIAGVGKAEMRRRVDEVLEQVGLSRDVVGHRRPHQLSGGQCQRVAIARALALNPKVIVCDEPVASLDVSVQAQVLNVLHDVKEANDLSLIFISHDLGVVRNVSDRVAVMYLGKIVEIGDADRVFCRPAHPYTRQLLSSIPLADRADGEHQEAPPELPSLANPPSGCRYRTRCPRATTLCAEQEPELLPMAGGHHVACHHPHDEPSPVSTTPPQSDDAG